MKFCFWMDRWGMPGICFVELALAGMKDNHQAVFGWTVAFLYALMARSRMGKS